LDEQSRAKLAKEFENTTGQEIIRYKIIPLTEEQYNKAFQFISTKKDEIYVGLGANCINFTQEVYNAAGLPGYYTENFSIEELSQVNSWANSYTIKNFPTQNLEWYEYGKSKEEVAVKFNLPIERISLAKNLPIRNNELNCFKIIPLTVYQASKAREQFTSVSDTAKAVQTLLAPITKKIQAGEILSNEEQVYGMVTAMNYFSEQKTSGNSGTEYNYNFVTNSGEIGAISNNIFMNQLLSSKQISPSDKALEAKILLAFNDAKLHADATMVSKVSEADITKIRQDTFAQLGLNPKVDLYSLLEVVTKKPIAKVTTVNDIAETIKPYVEFKEINGIPYSTLKTNSSTDNMSPVMAASIIKNAVSHTYGLSNNNAGFSVLATSSQEVADSFGVSVSDVIHKFAGTSLPDLEARQGKNVFSNIYEVKTNPTITPLSQADVVLANMSALKDPEFVVKFVTAPVAINAKAAEIINTKVKDDLPLTPIPSSVKNSKLQVNISEEIADSHAKNKEQLPFLWRDGVASLGGHHEIRMPSNILNGDGANNVRPSSIVTGGWRPGAKELSTFETDKSIKSIIQKQPEFSVSDVITASLKQAASFNRTKIGSFEQLNIDPIVIDMSGKGIALTHWQIIKCCSI
jgi:hypothetical protein